jgi:hypothetical protein
MRFFIFFLTLVVWNCETSQSVPVRTPVVRQPTISISGMEGQFSASDLELKDLAESGSKEQRLAVSQYFRKMSLVFRSEALKQETKGKNNQVDWEAKARAYEKVSDALAKSN